MVKSSFRMSDQSRKSDLRHTLAEAARDQTFWESRELYTCYNLLKYCRRKQSSSRRGPREIDCFYGGNNRPLWWVSIRRRRHSALSNQHSANAVLGMLVGDRG